MDDDLSNYSRGLATRTEKRQVLLALYHPGRDWISSQVTYPLPLQRHRDLPRLVARPPGFMLVDASSHLPVQGSTKIRGLGSSRACSNCI